MATLNAPCLNSPNSISGEGTVPSGKKQIFIPLFSFSLVLLKTAFLLSGLLLSTRTQVFLYKYPKIGIFSGHYIIYGSIYWLQF